MIQVSSYITVTLQQNDIDGPDAPQRKVIVGRVMVIV